jgi:hypothetical protein
MLNTAISAVPQLKRSRQECMTKKSLVNLLLLLGLFFIGCTLDHGGRDVPLDDDDSDSIISGVVAAGAPVRGVVVLKNASTNATSENLSDVIALDGTFSITLLDYMTGPYILEARGSAGGRSICLHSMGTRSDVSATVNITPLTDLICANVLGKDPDQYFVDFEDPQLKNVATEANLDKHEALIRSRLVDAMDSAGLGSGTFNLFNTDFVADHTGMDAFYDFIRVVPQWDADGTRLDTHIIRNALSGDEIIDDMTDETETSLLQAFNITEYNDASNYLRTISNLFDAWDDLFEDGPPVSGSSDYTELSGMFNNDFLFNGYDKDTFVEMICQNDDLEGMLFAGLSQESIDTVGETAVVSFTAGDGNSHREDMINWQLSWNGVSWKIRGNQQILGVYAGAYAAYSRSTNAVLYNGLCLYAHAPVESAAVGVDHIDVTGPGISGIVTLTRYDKDSTYFVDASSEPIGFYQPKDLADTDNPLVVTDNSNYAFTLYDSGNTVIDSYTWTVKRGNTTDADLAENKSTIFPVFETPQKILFDEFNAGENYLDCSWDLPARVDSLTIYYYGTNPNGEFSYSHDLETIDEEYTQLISQTEIQRMDIYLRTVDDYDRIRDTFWSKSYTDGNATKPVSIINTPNVF